MARFIFTIIAIACVAQFCAGQEPICDPLGHDPDIEAPAGASMGSANIGEPTENATISITNLGATPLTFTGDSVSSPFGSFYNTGLGTLDGGGFPSVLNHGETGTVVLYAIPAHEGYHCGFLHLDYFFDPLSPSSLTVILNANGVVPTGRAAGDFDGTGCTNLDDFLYLIDNWQSPAISPPLDITDFLALLDHWNQGASC